MAGIQLSGLSSGLDTASIIDSLMKIENVGRSRLSYKQVFEESRKSALTDIQAKLQTLKYAATDLGSAVTWVDTQSVSVENDAKLSATKTGGVGPGTYNFVVSQMASAARSTYEFQSPPSDIQLTVGNGSTSKTLTLQAGISLDDAVAKINSERDTGVFAVKVGSDLVLSSRTTGSADTITVEVDGVGVVPALSTVAGKDAQYTVDGGPVQTSATNTIKNAIPGLDVTLKGLTDSAGLSVTVGNPEPDTSAVKNKIKAFVSAYNDAISLIRTKYNEQPVAKPGNNVDAGKGALRGDSGLSQILSSMRSMIASEVGGSDSALSLLSQIGVSTGAVNTSGTLNDDTIAGKLTFDEKKFDEVYAADPNKVRKLLGADGEAFSQSFTALVSNYSSTGGQLSSRLTQADSTIQTVKDSLTAFDKRLEARRAFLEKQFQAMEAAMNSSNSLSQQLSAQLSALKKN